MPYQVSAGPIGGDRGPNRYSDRLSNTTSQVILRENLDNILNTVENLESVERVSNLIDFLRVPRPQGR